MGRKRQPGPLLKVHTERDDYFRTSASFAVSISVRQTIGRVRSVVPNHVGDL
jgi:hypothetical protein